MNNSHRRWDVGAICRLFFCMCCILQKFSYRFCMGRKRNVSALIAFVVDSVSTHHEYGKCARDFSRQPIARNGVLKSLLGFSAMVAANFCPILSEKDVFGGIFPIRTQENDDKK